MKKFISVFLVLLPAVMLAAGGVLSPATTALADSPGNVQVSLNVPDNVAPGDNFTVTVDINEVADFDAASYNVCFDADVLRLDNVTSGLIGVTTIPVNIRNQISSGTYTIVQNVPGLAGVTGSGYLAVVHFQVAGASDDSSDISLSNGALASNQAEGIPAIWSGGSVRVIPVRAPSTPAPQLPSPVSPTAKSINWLLLSGVTAGAIAAGVMIFFLARRRTR